MARLVFVDHRKSSFLNSGADDILYNRSLFAICSQFAAEDCGKTSKKKRPASAITESEVEIPEWPLDRDLAEGLKKFVNDHADKFSNEIEHDAGNSRAKRAVSVIPSAYFFQGCVDQVFHNEGDMPQRYCFQNRQFLLPPRSLGLLRPLSLTATADILEAGRTLYGSGGLFNIIVMDPPWINKSVKRQRRYMTVDTDDCLSQVAIGDLLSESGILAVWYTHNKSHYAQLKAQLTRWNLRPAATWTWLKVTTNALPVCPLGRNFKKPYEHVLLATRDVSHMDHLSRSDGTVAIAVPSAVHSHKPNLECLLEQFGIHCKKLRCLELFARTLKSNWVSCGNEVLKLQCLEMFDKEATPE
ncbi:methyltransferase protein 4-like [Tropilaelaps mercedesae]|uniref:Methyltransferase protein 4-like n=1 Tax=Tropilaelaps mercedesae TaxID=418985 RepID=A0A1V9XKN6_9ACAR|nr:methyltransferase protein 4-like [Tropilaelaps mercedesae]